MTLIIFLPRYTADSTKQASPSQNLDLRKTPITALFLFPGLLNATTTLCVLFYNNIVSNIYLLSYYESSSQDCIYINIVKYFVSLCYPKSFCNLMSKFESTPNFSIFSSNVGHQALHPILSQGIKLNIWVQFLDPVF